MKLRSTAMLVALLVAVVTGCTSSARTAVGPAHTAHRAAVTANTPVPYALYTHCGINDAKIGGRWFEADHPLSDGSGNPPPGWGNPFQQGTIKMLSATAAEFRDNPGHVVRFHLHRGPGTTGPKQVCALYHRAARQPQDPARARPLARGTSATIPGTRRCERQRRRASLWLTLRFSRCGGGAVQGMADAAPDGRVS